MFGEHENCLFQNENNAVLNENSVAGKLRINIEIKSLEITIEIHSCYAEHEDPSSCNTTVYLLYSITVPLVSIFSFLNLNFSCSMYYGILLVTFLVTPQVSTFYLNCTVPWKRLLSCRDYKFRIDGVFPQQYQKGSSL